MSPPSHLCRLETCLPLAKGELEPMGAFMSGRIKVEGDLTGALALQSVLGKLAG